MITNTETLDIAEAFYQNNIVAWRLAERPNKAIPLCKQNDHTVEWDDKGETLRCT
jgi:hypothetical protein